MPRKSTKTEVKATETAIETKVEDIKTEDKAAEKGTQSRMAADKICKCRKAGGNHGTAAFISVGHVLIACEQHAVQPFSVTGIGI